jgi:hypothetical protein
MTLVEGAQLFDQVWPGIQQGVAVRSYVGMCPGSHVGVPGSRVWGRSFGLSNAKMPPYDIVAVNGPIVGCSTGQACMYSTDWPHLGPQLCCLHWSQHMRHKLCWLIYP